METSPCRSRLEIKCEIITTHIWSVKIILYFFKLENSINRRLDIYNHIRKITQVVKNMDHFPLVNKNTQTKRKLKCSKPIVVK